jgi:subtilisin family serine protease
VIPVKVLSAQGSGSYSGVIAGVDYVGANGSNGDVANMSLGGPASQALDNAVIAASNQGIKFCVAAGNDGANSINYSPARANGANIYTISAMDNNDNWAYFSNYGNPPVDYCAPGVSVKSCWKNGGYNTISGTSMATPHAAGILLLGAAKTDGTVNGDPDGNADDIIVH